MATVKLDQQNYELPRQRKFTPASVTISLAAGANGVSDVVDKRGYGAIGVILPTLVSTTLSVEVSDAAGGTYQPLYNSVNTQISFATETGAKAIDLPELASFNFFRLKSSVDQSTAKTITVQGHV